MIGRLKKYEMKTASIVSLGVAVFRLCFTFASFSFALSMARGSRVRNGTGHSNQLRSP